MVRRRKRLNLVEEVVASSSSAEEEEDMADTSGFCVDILFCLFGYIVGDLCFMVLCFCLKSIRCQVGQCRGCRRAK